ncbi:MAG: hypothetical protein M2R45_00539 [Verrucomicrobia subdivision 3 bacterium]|nr:hypothetical protein [Limisphaerales bacterium]MCS1413583.1 hypothetical protein [Limisphaerales bacterium]
MYLFKELKKTGHHPDFWRALFASSILFMVVYSSRDKQPDPSLGCCLRLRVFLLQQSPGSKERSRGDKIGLLIIAVLHALVL